MQKLLWLEHLAIMLLGIWFCYSQSLSFAWYMWLLLFLLPDIGMLGYVANTRIGAATYNLTHHYGIAVAAIIAGQLLEHNWLLLAGSIMLCHAAFDRAMGYGLKYSDSFQHTHMGMIGKNRKPRA